MKMLKTSEQWILEVYKRTSGLGKGGKHKSKKTKYWYLISMFNLEIAKIQN